MKAVSHILAVASSLGFVKTPEMQQETYVAIEEGINQLGYRQPPLFAPGIDPYDPKELHTKYSSLLSSEEQQNHTGNGLYYHPGTPQQRAAQYTRLAQEDAEYIQTIFDIRGIIGSAQTAHHLYHLPADTWRKIAHSAAQIPEIGYSDVTWKHLALGKAGFTSPVYFGGVLNFLDEKYGGFLSPEERKAHLNELKVLLSGQQKEVTFTIKPLNAAAKAKPAIEGQVIGGYLSVVNASIGTPFEIEAPKGKKIILALEGFCPPGGEVSLKATLNHLKEANSGVWENISAIVIGDYMNIEQFEAPRPAGWENDPEKFYHPRAKRFIEELAAEFPDKPIFTNLTIGHSQSTTHPLPLFTDSRIEVQSGGKQAVLRVNTQRNPEECKAAREAFLQGKEAAAQPASNVYPFTRQSASYTSRIAHRSLSPVRRIHTPLHLTLEAVNKKAKERVPGAAPLQGIEVIAEIQKNGTAKQTSFKDGILYISADLRGQPEDYRFSEGTPLQSWAVRTHMEALDSLFLSGRLKDVKGIIIGSTHFPEHTFFPSDRSEVENYLNRVPYLIANLAQTYGQDIPVWKAISPMKAEGRFQVESVAIRRDAQDKFTLESVVPEVKRAI